MTEKKDVCISLRLSKSQIELLEKLIKDGKAKNQSSAVHYLINQYGILGK
ncbi:hypothetical protein [Escherichia coli]|nr:hypothetical protein [Escherichia coli]EFT2988839.1 hypothetical protein [Escherichia coli]EHJ7898372.1 hypothetical protein [Escherichia coli]EIV7777873.1 hypothetical protein [Escherichia coli]EJK2775799.1 hypothetical protein [Escherichia coli]EJZ4184963.1 hypothetical protein [Escherichia coli]